MIYASGDRTAIEQLLAKAPLLHIRRFAVFCALDALATTRCSDVRLHLAVQTLRRYVEGEATREELQRTADAAYVAGAAGAAAHAVWYAAYAAAGVAYAAGVVAGAVGAGAAGAVGAGAAGAAHWAAAAAYWATGVAEVAAGAAGATRQRQADAWARISLDTVQTA